MKTSPVTHTPGPWHIEPCIWGGYPLRISGPGDSAGAAGMFSPALILGDGTHNRGTAEANARLVAALKLRTKINAQISANRKAKARK